MHLQGEIILPSGRISGSCLNSWQFVELIRGGKKKWPTEVGHII
jgi:hypothetical protein